MTTTQNAGTVNAVTPEFKALCEQHGVQATKRQHSKWNNQHGALWLKVHGKSGDHYAKPRFIGSRTDESRWTPGEDDCETRLRREWWPSKNEDKRSR